jgi:hypothetical protein
MWHRYLPVFNTAHIETIFKFLPHTRQHGCIDILHCCNDPCLWVSEVTWQCWDVLDKKVLGGHIVERWNYPLVWPCLWEKLRSIVACKLMKAESGFKWKCQFRPQMKAWNAPYPYFHLLLLRLYYFSTLPHKRQDFRKNVTEHKIRVSFSLQLLSETFLILRNERDIHWSSRKVPAILVRLNKTWTISTDFWKRLISNLIEIGVMGDQ